MSEMLSFTGVDDVFKNLLALDKKTQAAAAKALQTEGWAVMNESKKMCPVAKIRGGTLVTSGGVGWLLDPFPHVFLYYSPAYALVVHERSESASGAPINYNRPGSSHHFLSIPLHNSRAGWRERVGKLFWDLLWKANMR